MNIYQQNTGAWVIDEGYGKITSFASEQDARLYYEEHTMETTLQNFISRMGADAKTLLDLYGPLTQQNVLWSGSPAYNTDLTQEKIDGEPRLAEAELTVQQVADTAYAMEQVRTILTNAMPALTVLANLP
jgi:hypothetical protein